jgi:HPt (histidine-containing phosphotransfer) domain-containing protein
MTRLGMRRVLQRAEVIELTLAGLASFEADCQVSRVPLRSQLHRLASAVGIVGCMRLSAQARALERALIERAATEDLPSLSASRTRTADADAREYPAHAENSLTKVFPHVAIQETARC